MPPELPFISELHKNIHESLKNDLGTENWDSEVLGEAPETPLKKAIETKAIGTSLEEILLEQSPVYRRITTEFAEGLNNLYLMLNDEASRKLLVEVMAYKILGHKFVRLCTNNETYWRMRKSLSALPPDDKGLVFEQPPFKRPTSFYDLAKVGFPITAYGYPPSLTHTFLCLHYDYAVCQPPIAVREGDCVLDAGACWGDTSLLFAHKAGSSGKVYAFEFNPLNLKIIDKVKQLNEELAPRISIIQKALWNESGVVMNFEDHGPATKLSTKDQEAGGGNLQVETITIDDLCREVGPINYIKMDIEGAELPALQGAAETIKKYQPKLAISLYHKLSDHVTIPKFLQSLDVNYEYYLKHPTIFHRETVLFASPKQ